MKKVIFLVNYIDSNGTFADRHFDTDEEAKAFEEQYKYYFKYRPKSYKTLKITKTFFKGSVECVREWHN
jgi:hypothetical protein